MATATAMHTNGKAKDKSLRELMDERRKRAEQGLASGAYTVEFTGKEQGAWSWTVHGPHGAYAVTAHKEEGGWRWQCTCQDFRRHADTPGWKCKHIHMVELAHRKEGKSNGKPHKTNGRVKAARGEPVAAPTALSGQDLMRALEYAVWVIEPGGVKEGEKGWEIRDEAGTTFVTRQEGRLVCSACGAGECKHTVAVEVFETMKAEHMYAPLPATRVLAARRGLLPGSASIGAPGREESRPRMSVTVTGSDGAELIRVLGVIGEQLQELNHNLQALERRLGNVEAAIGTEAHNLGVFHADILDIAGMMERFIGQLTGGGSWAR